MVGQVEKLDNWRMDAFSTFAYNLRMGRAPLFRDRLKAAMAAADMSKADLARASGVGYHTIDKLLKRDNARTSAETARKLAKAVGISVDGEGEYEELRRYYLALPPETREVVLRMVRGFHKDGGDKP